MRGSAAKEIIRRTSADRPEFVDSRANLPTFKLPKPGCGGARPGYASCPLLRPVTHCLDLIAVGIAQERAVFGGVVVAQAG
jgi:hypothetical protein